MDIERMAKLMNNIQELITPATCKHCQSKRTRRYGHTRAKRQRWLCRDCHHTFIENENILPGMKTPTEQIGAALAMFYEGLSLNAIRRHLKQFYGNMPSDSTVYEWITRYSKEAINKDKEYTPKVGDVWMIDETVLKIAGKNVWFYDVLDMKTRYLLSSHLAEKRYLGDARLALGRAGRKADMKPRIVISDGLPSYPQAVGDVFGCATKHIKYKGFTTQPNNNMLERFHGTLKARTKIMRGLKSMETARLFTKGWLIFYNHFRPHESLDDKSPASKAGIKFAYSGWKDVVAKSPFKAEPVKWAGDNPVIKNKEPKFETKIPKSVKRMMGMGGF